MPRKSAKTDILNSINVLAGDDEKFALRSVIRILEMLGIGEVLTAENGADAIEKLRETNLDIDLIISDIEMPELDGYELVRRVRYGVVPKFKDAPILILTGKDTDENVLKARFHKISGFIVKPPNAESLEREIRKAFGF